jgi:hypothetical protein
MNVVITHLRWILAHQGGWDELIMFGIPIVLAIVGVRWADRRAKATRSKSDAPVSDDGRHDESDNG